MLIEREDQIGMAEGSFDPTEVETGKELVAWIEADPANWRGMRTIGDHRYLLIEDPYRTTATKNALFRSTPQGWIAMSAPSDPAVRTPEMHEADDGHFVDLVNDIELLEQMRAALAAQKAEQEALMMRNKGCTDFVMRRNTAAAAFYLSTLKD